MEFLNKLSDFIKLCFDIFIEIWADLLFKIAGNLFPLYIGAFILLLVDRSLINKVFDPVSFILYSSTFLFSSMYLWYKTLDVKNKNGLIVFLFFLLFAIIISLMYAFTFIKRDNKFDLNFWSYIVFTVCLFFYIIYEFISYFKVNKSNFRTESDNDYKSFKDSYRKIDNSHE